MPPILTLDAALAGCSVGLVADGRVIAQRADAKAQAQALPALARAVLDESDLAPSFLAVTVGPGSFTGLRAALALAHGIALGRGIPVLGVTVGEAIAAVLPDIGNLWVAVDTRRGRVFLDRDGVVESFDLDALPLPAGAMAIAGDAAEAVAARLRARGADAHAVGAPAPTPLGIALAAWRRMQSGLPPRPAQPLYVDPPEARPGRRGRPAPA